MPEAPEHLRVHVTTSDPETAEWLAAEAWELGAGGIEDRGGDERGELLIYVPEADAARLVETLRELAPDGAAIGDAEAFDPVDWSEAWKEGFEVIEISARLRVRPRFVEAALPDGQREVRIDPGSAFGTGSHASTRLTLEAIDATVAAEGPAETLLDVGTGTGVLAIAGLCLGVGRAVAFDLDPLAAPEATRWAHENGVADRLELFTGGIEGIHGKRFEWVVANLLRREMLPIALELSEALAPRGRLMLSGLLASERDEVEAELGSLGLETLQVREIRDATGDHWIGLVMGWRSPR